jgi:hypothetical protein
MMRPFQLPPPARQRLAELRAQMMAAEDAARAALARIKMLPSEGVDEIRDRLVAEQQKQQARHAQLHRLFNAVMQNLEETSHVALVQLAPAVELELKNGETLDSKLNAVRSEIKKLQQELRQVRFAPLPVADQKELAMKFVAGLVNAGRPTISFQRDQLQVQPRGDMVAAMDVLALVAWAAPAELLESLEREIDRLPASDNALPAGERIARTTDIADRLLQLERLETALVERGCADGLPLLHRFDVDPRAFLGITVKAQAQAVA